MHKKFKHFLIYFKYKFLLLLFNQYYYVGFIFIILFSFKSGIVYSDNQYKYINYNGVFKHDETSYQNTINMYVVYEITLLSKT